MEQRINKIVVRSRRSEDEKVKGSCGETNLSSTTSGSPNSPKRIRIILPESSSCRKRKEFVIDQSDASTVSSFEPTHRRKTPVRLEELVSSTSAHLWNRDGTAGREGYGEDFRLLRLTALWYLDLYMGSLLRTVSEEEETAVGLAAVFLSFKAADYIPGAGRVKMHQLVEAYERAKGGPVAADPDRLVQRICQTEMELMCLSGFNFCPCPPPR